MSTYAFIPFRSESPILIISIPQVSTPQSYHVIHLILPTSINHLPSLHVSAPSPVIFSLHPSASDIAFGSFCLQLEGDVSLPPIEGKHVNIETVGGNIKGSFNVTERLILKTVTGDISANISVHPRLEHDRPRGRRCVSQIYESDGEERTDDQSPKRSLGKSHGYKHVKRSWWPFGRVEDLEELVEDDPQHDGANTKETVEYEGLSTTVNDEIVINLHSNDESLSIADEFERPGPPWSGRGPSRKGPNGHHGPHRPDGPGSHGPDQSDGPRDPHHPDRPRGPHGPDEPRGPRGPGGPAPPAFIGAFSSTGSIDLHFDQPPFVSSDVKAFSHTGSVKVQAASSFKGYFRAGVSAGNVSAVTGGSKKIEIVKQVSSRTGGFVEGFVSFQHSRNASEVNDIELEYLDVQDWIIGRAEGFDRLVVLECVNGFTHVPSLQTPSSR